MNCSEWEESKIDRSDPKCFWILCTYKDSFFKKGGLASRWDSVRVPSDRLNWPSILCLSCKINQLLMEMKMLERKAKSVLKKKRSAWRRRKANRAHMGGCGSMSKLHSMSSAIDALSSALQPTTSREDREIIIIYLQDTCKEGSHKLYWTSSFDLEELAPVSSFKSLPRRETGCPYRWGARRGAPDPK